MSSTHSNIKPETLPLILVEEISWQQAHKFFAVALKGQTKAKTTKTLTK